MAEQVPLGTLIMQSAARLVGGPSQDEMTAGKEQLSDEVAREEAKARIAITVAQAQQEFAIATRIMSAEEVMIEEYYDATGAGSLGLDADENVELGVKGSGRKIVKRIVRLKGWPKQEPTDLTSSPPSRPDDGQTRRE